MASTVAVPRLRIAPADTPTTTPSCHFPQPSAIWSYLRDSERLVGAGVGQSLRGPRGCQSQPFPQDITPPGLGVVSAGWRATQDRGTKSESTRQRTEIRRLILMVGLPSASWFLMVFDALHVRRFPTTRGEAAWAPSDRASLAGAPDHRHPPPAGLALAPHRGCRESGVHRDAPESADRRTATPGSRSRRATGRFRPDRPVSTRSRARRRPCCRRQIRARPTPPDPPGHQRRP